MKIDSKAYREVFDLHKATVDMVNTTPVSVLWDWYWNQARAICEAHNNDEFVMDLLIAVAGAVERRQLVQIHAGRVA